MCNLDVRSVNTTFSDVGERNLNVKISDNYVPYPGLVASSKRPVGKVMLEVQDQRRFILGVRAIYA